MNKFQSAFEADLAALITQTEALLSPADQSPALHWAVDPDASRFGTLARVFGLSFAHSALLQLLVVHHFRPDLSGQFEARGTVPYVHEALVRDLFSLDQTPIYTSDSPLNQWQLISARDMGPGAPIAFELDLAVVEWMAGRPGLSPLILRQLERIVGSTPDAQAIDFAKSCPSDDARPLVCLIQGDAAPKSAAQIARAFGMGLWKVSAETLDDIQIGQVHRFATVQHAALCWDTSNGLDPKASPPAKLQFAPEATPSPRLRIVHFDAEKLTHASLAAKFRDRFPNDTPDAIAYAASLRDAGVWLDHEPDTRDLAAFTQRLIARNTQTLQAFAVSVSADVSFDDLVLPAVEKAKLRGLADSIRLRHRLWQNPEVARVYAQERAMTILMQGVPGTGKTMTAKVLANAVGMPLFRVDMARLTSKYIGETTKHLRALFDAANQSGAILFIDEFEAIASRRTDARNEVARSYNQDTAYLLQLIETSLDGIAIFATNRPKDIDEAMMRRIRHVIDFHPPQQDQRAELWQRALAPFNVSAEVAAIAPLLAEQFDFTAARIKAVVLNAFTLCSSGESGITLATLRAAALTEAQAQGRLPGRRELQHLNNFGDKAGTA